ncbi:MAG: hypothetical protein R3B99_19260 [Polyangiales bacterium]
MFERDLLGDRVVQEKRPDRQAGRVQQRFELPGVVHRHRVETGATGDAREHSTRLRVGVRDRCGATVGAGPRGVEATHRRQTLTDPVRVGGHDGIGRPERERADVLLGRRAHQRENRQVKEARFVAKIGHQHDRVRVPEIDAEPVNA